MSITFPVLWSLSMLMDICIVNNHSFPSFVQHFSRSRLTVHAQEPRCNKPEASIKMAVLSKMSPSQCLCHHCSTSLSMLRPPVSHRNSILNILHPKTRPYFLHSGSSQQVFSQSFRLLVTSQIYWLHWIISSVIVWITRNTIDDLSDFLQ